MNLSGSKDLLGKRLVEVQDQSSGFTAVCLVEMETGLVEQIQLGGSDSTLQSFDLSEALSAADRAEVEKIVAGGYRGDKFKEAVLKLSKNILASFFQTMHSRRSFWRNELSTDSRA